MRSVAPAISLAVALLVAISACAGSATTGTPSGTPAFTTFADPSSAAASPPTATATASSSTAMAERLRAALDVERTSYHAAGALGVVRTGDGQFTAAFGAADLDGTPITDTTRFRIASITKPIVAALVLDAVARGKLQLDDVVDDLLPGIVRATPSITMRQLLAHTAGIFDEGNEGDPEADVARLTDPALKAEGESLVRRYQAGEHVIASDRLLVALAETHDRYFAPGEGYHYSNVGYQLAAMLLEHVTGLSLSDLLRTRIVDPLGLRHTTIAPPDLTSPEFRGYDASTVDGSPVDVTDDLLAFGNGGNGGVISTADELLTIMQAIVTGRLLPAALVEEMERPVLESYGLGLATYDLSCGRFYGHGGSVNGTQSIALVTPDGADGIVMAINFRSADDPGLPGLADRVLCQAS
jgi:D-alanyl-D-alanine carboxypeptidase